MLKPGDVVWSQMRVNGLLGNVPLVSRTNAEIIPDVPNLAHIARYLAEHPETVDALEVAAATARYMESVLPSSLPERRDAADVVKGLIAAMRGEGGE